MDSRVIVGGVEIPAALDGLKVGYQDVDYESGRTAKGDMKRNRVAVKRTIDITTPPMRPAKMSAVLSAISGSSFTVSFYDPQSGGRASGTFYTGDRSVPTYSDYMDLFNSMTISLVEF